MFCRFFLDPRSRRYVEKTGAGRTIKVNAFDAPVPRSYRTITCFVTSYICTSERQLLSSHVLSFFPRFEALTSFLARNRFRLYVLPVCSCVRRLVADRFIHATSVNTGQSWLHGNCLHRLLKNRDNFFSAFRRTFCYVDVTYLRALCRVGKIIETLGTIEFCSQPDSWGCSTTHLLIIRSDCGSLQLRRRIKCIFLLSTDILSALKPISINQNMFINFYI